MMTRPQLLALLDVVVLYVLPTLIIIIVGGMAWFFIHEFWLDKRAERRQQRD